MFLEKTDEHHLDNLIKSHTLNLSNPAKYLIPVRVEHALVLGMNILSLYVRPQWEKP